MTLQHTLMNHTRTTRDVDEQVRQYKKIIATGKGKAPLIFGETNSLYFQGKPGLSNSFGAALWGLDFNLYSASAGYQRVHMHQGTNYRVRDTLKRFRGDNAHYFCLHDNSTKAGSPSTLKRLSKAPRRLTTATLPPPLL